jgi:glutamate N-acetyltransferase/amino-acid N-acetyltransferase
VASTGVIGVPLPVDRITTAIHSIELRTDAWDDVAKAMMTTDTKPKLARDDYPLVWRGASGTVHTRAVAKGAGMIHPNMATLLSFIVTDAAIPLEALRAMTKRIADHSFNAISIDGDTSTNDTLLILANGASGVLAVDEAEALLDQVCTQLAREIVADGEGVTKVFEVRVTGAASDDDAKKAARTITTSNLVKTAIHGADPNWGRIIAAAGRSGARVDDRKASVRIGPLDVFRAGTPVKFDPQALRAAFSEKEITIELALGLGSGSAVAWGTDLSAEYVHINADYIT